MIPRLAVLIVFVWVGGIVAAKPLLYRLWVVNRDGKIGEALNDLLARKLEGVDVQAVSQRERYKNTPHFPVPVCAREEYYLLSPGEELIAIGCLDSAKSAAKIPDILKAIRTYESEISRGVNPTVLSRRTGS